MVEKKKEKCWKILTETFFKNLAKVSGGLLAVWLCSFLPGINKIVNQYKNILKHEESAAKTKAQFDSATLKQNITFENLRLLYRADSFAHNDSTHPLNTSIHDSLKQQEEALIRQLFNPQ